MVDNIDEFRHLSELTESADIQLKDWSPPGPLSLRYVQTEKPVRGMIGPLGSGKTTTMLAGEVFCAIRAPKCVDGVRRYSVLCTRDSYRQLYKTAIPSWQELFPPTVGEWSGGQDRPAEHRLRFVDNYGPVEFRIEFSAIPDGSIRDWLDGYQVTSLIMNAANSHPFDVYAFGGTRINRYPKKKLLPKGYRNEAHIGFDMNKTDVDEWVYDEFVLNYDPNIMEILDFPGGLEPGAENVHNLDEGYYQDNIKRMRSQPWLIDILIHNKWGASRSGQPVFPEYDDAKHLATGHNGGPPMDIDAIPGVPLLIGLDAGTEKGGRPAAVFFQVVAPYRVRVIDELYLGRCGPNRFGDALLAKLDEPHLRDATHGLRGFPDPSAFYGADEEGDEITWLDVIEGKLGIDLEEPESNELEGFRLETVRVLLTGYEDGWMFQLSPRCKMLRKGFNSGYHYVREETRKGVTEKDRPNKNEYSHPMDALQHGVTGFFGRSLIVNMGRSRMPATQQPGRIQLTSESWDPFA